MTALGQPNLATPSDAASVSPLRLIIGSFKAQWIILAAAIFFYAICELMLAGVADRKTASIGFIVKSMFTTALPMAVFVLLIVRFFQYAVYIKPDSPARQLLADVRAVFSNARRTVNALPVFLALVLENKAAMDLKANIPALVPFSWDEFFMKADRALHFGHDPWQLIQPVLGFPIVTFIISVGYNAWLLLLFFLWAWFAFDRNCTELRTRFFLSFILTWMIGGGLMAVYFSSAGPVYYALLGLKPDPFAGLLQYLEAANEQFPIWALNVQALLWEQYTTNAPHYVGISAFPSMHNAMVALFAFTFFKLNRTLGYIMAAYAALILLGSVHLGWHYAIDGYASIALAALCWWVSGKIAAWNQRQSWTVRHQANLDTL